MTDQSPPTEDEARAGFRAAINLFEKWQLSESEAATALDLDVVTLHQWRDQGPGHIGRDRALRISLLMGIHKCLRILFSEPERGYAWIRKPNPDIGNLAPFEVIVSGNLIDLIALRRWLGAIVEA